MSARDELADLLAQSEADQTSFTHYPSYHRQTATDLLAAGYRKPRTITTAEELGGLALESVVKSADGNVWESLAGGWFETCSRSCHVASDIALPATVLYDPATPGLTAHQEGTR